MPKNTILYVRLAELLHRRLKAEAALQGRPLSDVVGDAVEQYLRGRQIDREAHCHAD